MNVREKLLVADHLAKLAPKEPDGLAAPRARALRGDEGKVPFGHGLAYTVCE